MMSRSLYKGLKIEHYPDELAVPVPRLPERAPLQPMVAPNTQMQRKASAPFVKGNLFACLAEDAGCEDDSDASYELEDGEIIDEHDFPIGFEDKGVEIQWADSVVVA
jgi:hypothetical protein